MPVLSRAIRPFGLAALLATALAGCATRLAPAYDASIANGVSQLQTDTAALFSTVSAGTTPGSFATRQPQYDKVIGEADDLAQRAGQRPVPSNVVVDTVQQHLPGDPGGLSGPEVAPSATALKTVSTTVTKMKGTDQGQGLTPLVAQAFQGQANLALSQAAAYEAALKR